MNFGREFFLIMRTDRPSVCATSPSCSTESRGIRSAWTQWLSCRVCARGCCRLRCTRTATFGWACAISCCSACRAGCPCLGLCSRSSTRGCLGKETNEIRTKEIIYFMTELLNRPLHSSYHLQRSRVLLLAREIRV